MKRWAFFMVPVFACVVTVSAETIPEVYARGMRASMQGDDATAKQCFQQVLAADPGNRAAAIGLRRIELAAVAKGDLKSRVEALIVPKVDFKDASLNAVLDYLPKLAAQQKVTLNIVRLFPKDYGDEKKITLQLAAVPMSSVLDYIAQLGGVTVDYQRSAVLVKLQASHSETAIQ